jgi:hypothetical protein
MLSGLRPNKLNLPSRLAGQPSKMRHCIVHNPALPNHGRQFTFENEKTQNVSSDTESPLPDLMQSGKLIALFPKIWSVRSLAP